MTVSHSHPIHYNEMSYSHLVGICWYAMIRITFSPDGFAIYIYYRRP